MGITGINWDPQRHVRLIAGDVRTRRVIQLPEPGGSVSAQASAPAKTPATEPPGKLFPTVHRGDIVGFADAGSGPPCPMATARSSHHSSSSTVTHRTPHGYTGDAR